MKRNIVSVFKPHGRGLTQIFGTLEADIMALVWERQAASARDIFEALRDRGQKISYGATKTVLDRLVDKQVLYRVMDSNQYTYSAKLDRDTYTRSAIGEIIDGLLAGFGTPVYAQFFDHLRSTNPEELDRLEDMIKASEEQNKDDA